EDDDNKDPEEDPVDYLTDRGDDSDDEEGSSEDDEDDDMDIEVDKEEEEEHPAPADSIVIPFPPLPPILSPPSPVLSPAPPPSPIRSLGYRAAMIRLQAEAASTSSPPLQPPSASRKEDKPEFTLPPRKRLDIALGPRYEMTKIKELHAADHRRQTVILELLKTDHRRSTEITELRTALQGQMTALQGQVTALQA
nr:hypothetical protein [Tanacetum cinerariifolium]